MHKKKKVRFLHLISNNHKKICNTHKNFKKTFAHLLKKPKQILHFVKKFI